MKVRISIPGTYMVAEVPEQTARRAFWKMSEILQGYSHLALPEEGAGKEEEEGAEEQAAEGGISAEGETEDLEEMASEETECVKYKGFLYIRCPKCGEVKSFFTRNATDHYRCDHCGARTEFEAPLSPLWINCECGNTVRYFTNLAESSFDMECFKCGAPVAIEWNSRKHLYVTMKD